MKRVTKASAPVRASDKCDGKPHVCPLCGSVLKNEPEETSGLTARQKEVIRLIAEGMTAKQIAAELSISSRTAEFHRKSLMGRLRLRTTAELTLYAARHGLL